MRLLVVLLTLFTFSTCGQSIYFVKEAVSEEAIPFVKVIPNDAEPFIADLDGAFQLKNSTERITLKYRGYIDTTIELKAAKDSVIYMRSMVQNINEIIVYPGENPAHQIISKAIANRKANHPLKNHAFKYDSYSKFIFDINREGLSTITDSTSDSTLLSIRDFFNRQHLFAMESASTRTFTPPDHDREEITTYKISGFKDPRFSTFANGMQSFSFYDNQISLLGKSYVNPIAGGGIKRYLFILEDTTFQETDTTYTIYFRPRKGKMFKGLEGHLYINTNGFAIEKVVASPHIEEPTMRVKVIQEYKFIDNVKWFPSKLSTSVEFPSVSINKHLKVIGYGHSYIRNIEINPSNIPKRFDNNISVYTANGAADETQKVWDSIRNYPLTHKEIQTYESIDSLSAAQNFEKRLNILTTLSEGKIPIGPVNIDVSRLLFYNPYEKSRLGLGLETSEKLMKRFLIGGYFAYGTGDKKWKYGGSATLLLNKKRGTKIILSYQQDIFERGGNQFYQSGFDLTSSDAYHSLFDTSMDRQRIGEVTFTRDLKANITARFFGNYQRISFTQGYEFTPTDATYTHPTDIDLAETGFELKWSVKQKYMLLGNTKVTNQSKFPTIKIKATKGWKGWFESNYNYLRLNASIDQEVKLIGLGTLKMRAEAGKTIENVPLFLSQQMSASKRDWSISIENSFETMVPATFFNNEFAALFVRLHFNEFRTKALWNEPKISFHHALGFGSFVGKEQHNVDFQSMEKGYYESGLILNGIITSRTLGLGIGIFYNYGYYASSNWKMNVVPKITFSANL